MMIIIVIKHVVIDRLCHLQTTTPTNLPVSGAVQEDEIIMITCSVTYSGNWAPVMRWFDSDTRRNFTDDDNTSITTINDTTVTSQLTVSASADLKGSKIVCVTSFDQPSTSLPSNAATNVPSYSHTWMSPTLNVALRCK